MTNLSKNEPILNLFTKNIKKDENISLSKSAVGDYALPAFAKSEAKPENLNLLQGEQQHAKRAFFVRRLRTSKETQRIAIVQALRGSLSMVGRNGKGSPFADFLVGQFLSPLRSTAQTLRSLAVVLSNHYKETAKMLSNSHLADFPQNLTPCNCTKQHEFLYETTINPVKAGNSSQLKWGNIAQNVQEKLHKSCNPEQKTILPTLAVIGYPFGVVAKSTASRRKLNNLLMANDSTPLTRAFFVRRLRTPKINLAIDLFSMVGRKGQRLGVGCVPLVAVFLPLYALPPTVGKLAVDTKNLLMELSKMLFKFLVLGEKRLTISIRAKSEAEARQKLQFTSPALCVARYPSGFKTKWNGGIYA